MIQRFMAAKVIAEDEFVEYMRCKEQLISIGISERDIDNHVLNCITCIKSGICSVKPDCVFLGAKTC